MTDRAPLSGIVVLELSVFGLGSLAGVALADLGADVIKIETPHGGDPGRAFAASAVDVVLSDGRNAFFETFNRGKRGIALNLKEPEGLKIGRDLAAGADVVIENFRPGALERLGLGYDALARVNAGLVYASASGFGPYGSERDRPGLDYVGQARTAYMWTFGSPGDPPFNHTIGPADMVGSMMLTQGVLAGLAARAATGRGCLVETSHVGAMMWLQYFNLSLSVFTGAPDWPRESPEAPVNPLAAVYECADGRWVALGLVPSQRYWIEFCRTIGRPELEHDERFETHEARQRNSAALTAILRSVFRQRPCGTWDQLLRSGNFIYEVVQTVDDLRSDAQIHANDYLLDLEYATLGTRAVVRLPFHFDGVPVASRRVAPGHGEHTWEVLKERLGMTLEQLNALAQRGAIS